MHRTRAQHRTRERRRTWGPQRRSELHIRHRRPACSSGDVRTCHAGSSRSSVSCSSRCRQHSKSVQHHTPGPPHTSVQQRRWEPEPHRPALHKLAPHTLVWCSSWSGNRSRLRRASGRASQTQSPGHTSQEREPSNQGQHSISWLSHSPFLEEQIAICVSLEPGHYGGIVRSDRSTGAGRAPSINETADELRAAEETTPNPATASRFARDEMSYRRLPAALWNLHWHGVAATFGKTLSRPEDLRKIRLCWALWVVPQTKSLLPI